MAQSAINEIGVDLVRSEFEVNASSSQIGSWSLDCDIRVQDSDTDIREIKVNDITLSGDFTTEEFSVEINTKTQNNTDIDIDFIVGGIIGSGVTDDLNAVKESLSDINETIKGISEESSNIKVTINGIQSQVNTVESELTNKADAETIVQIGEDITEVQKTVAEQTLKVSSIESEISNKASSESVTVIANDLILTNNAIAEQSLKVSDLESQIESKASASSVTTLSDELSITNESLAEQVLKVSVLESEISSKASTESVSQIGDSLTLLGETVAEQVLKTDALDASISTLVSKEIFEAKTGEIESSFTEINQTTEAIQTTIKDQSGSISSLIESVNGLSVGVGKIQDDVDTLQSSVESNSKYIDDIVKDNVLTPIEKEQLFEIYRSIAREYDATKGNAYNYKIWRYKENSNIEEAGLNGNDGRYELYVSFKSAYNVISDVFNLNEWGFDKMDETTTLSEEYTISLLKKYLDNYYEAYGLLTEAFSSITAAIEDAQKRAGRTLEELTGVLSPEEMYTQIGKGVVLSTIIATRDVDGNITAGMNASSSQSDTSEENHGRVVFVGGAKDIDDFNNAAFVVYEDGHVKMQSALISEYASISALQMGLDEKTNVKDFQDLLIVVNNIVKALEKMWHIEGDDIVTDYNIVTTGEISAGGAGTESGEGGGGTSTGDYKMYHHPQDEAASVWRVEHGLGKFPNVRVLDSNKELCYGDVQYINTSVLTITFGAPFSGDAYCD
jgi:hypothetical protein